MYHSGSKLIDPALLFGKSGLASGMHVGVFGTGRTGHIVFPAARIVGEQGAVYAVDIMKDVLAILSKRAKLDAVPQVHTVWSDLEKPGKTAIPAHSLDQIFMVNLLSALRDRIAVMNEAERLAKNAGAKLVIADWTHPGLTFAPREEQIIRFDGVVRWGQAHGFSLQKEFEVGDYHRGLILSR